MAIIKNPKIMFVSGYPLTLTGTNAVDTSLSDSGAKIKFNSAPSSESDYSYSFRPSDTDGIVEVYDINDNAYTLPITAGRVECAYIWRPSTDSPGSGYKVDNNSWVANNAGYANAAQVTISQDSTILINTTAAASTYSVSYTYTTPDVSQNCYYSTDNGSTWNLIGGADTSGTWTNVTQLKFKAETDGTAPTALYVYSSTLGISYTGTTGALTDTTPNYTITSNASDLVVSLDGGYVPPIS